MSPLGTVLLLVAGSLLCTAVSANSQGDASTAGYLFTAQQSLTSVTISAAAINPSGSTSYVDVIFPNTQLPSQGCGDRYARCDVTLVSLESTNSSEVVVLVAIGSGAAVALFNKSQSNLILLENYTLSLPGTPNSCSLTSFIQDQTSLYGLCYQFTSDEGQVMLDVYRTIKSTDRFFFSPHIAVTGQFFVSKAFLSSCSGFPKIYWFGNAFLYNLRVDIQPSFLEHQDLEDFPECFGNGTRQLALFQDNSLLAYCGSSSTVEIDLCGIEDPIRTPTRFYCSESGQRYLSIQNGLLSVNSSVDYVIPFPLDTNVVYVGDCVEIGERAYFIGSSVSGVIALINVLDNLTTLLTTDAPVNHRVIENRFILYSNSTSSNLLDLSCGDPTTPIHVNAMTFDLANFSPNTPFTCSTIQLPTMVTTVATLSLGAIVGIIIGALISCALVFVVTVIGILCLIRTKWSTSKRNDGITQEKMELGNLSLENHSVDAKKKATTPLTAASSAVLSQKSSPETPGSSDLTSTELKVHDRAASDNIDTPIASCSIRDKLPKLELAENTSTIATGVPEEDSEFNHSGCLPNKTTGTPILPIYTGPDNQTSRGNPNTVNGTAANYGSGELVNAETVQPNNENDTKIELVTNQLFSVPTINRSTRMNPQAQPQDTSPPGDSPLTSNTEAVQVLDTQQNCHITEPGHGLPLASNAFHSDQLKWNHSQQQSMESPNHRTAENTHGIVNSVGTNEPDNERSLA